MRSPDPCRPARTSGSATNRWRNGWPQQTRAACRSSSLLPGTRRQQGPFAQTLVVTFHLEPPSLRAHGVVAVEIQEIHGCEVDRTDSRHGKSAGSSHPKAPATGERGYRQARDRTSSTRHLLPGGPGHDERHWRDGRLQAVCSDSRRRPHPPRRTLPDGTRRWEGPTCVRLRPAASTSTRCASGHCGSPCAVKPDLAGSRRVDGCRSPWDNRHVSDRQDRA